MNMYSSTKAEATAAESIGCVRDLLIETLAVIDAMQLPGDIGAHLDLTIHKLGAFATAGSDARLESMLN